MSAETKDENILQVTDSSFEQDVIKAQAPVLVDFWAPWCGPCKMIAPVLEELVTKYEGRLKVAKINVDENTAVAAQMGVRSIPMLVLFKEGKAVESVVGARPLEELETLVNKWL